MRVRPVAPLLLRGRALDNFIFMLDGFWKYLAEAMAKETKLDVHLWTASDVNIDDTSIPQSDRAS